MNNYIGAPLYNKQSGNLVGTWLPEQTPADINATEKPKPAGLYIWSEENDDWVVDTATQAALDSLPAVIQLEAWKFRKALQVTGLLQTIEEMLSQPGHELLKIDFEYRTMFHSDHPDITAMGAAIGKTPDQIKQVFALGLTFT